MTLIKEYQYQERHQRFLSYFAVFLINLLFGFYALKSAVTVKGLFFYGEMLRYLLLYYLAVHFAGIVTGSLIFRVLKKSRIAFLVMSYLFVLLLSGFVLLLALVPDLDYHIATIWAKNLVFPVSAAAIIPFLTGMANNFYLRILSGKFFDEKKGAHVYLLLLISGVLFGGVVFIVSEYFALPQYWVLAGVIALAVLPVFIRLEYSPVSFIAREFGDIPDKNAESLRYRDDLMFNYLNFTCFVIFAALGLQTAVRFYGDFLYVKLFYCAVFSSALLAGYLISMTVRKAFWHIYTQMLYPFFFIFFFIMLQRFSSIPYYYALLFASPLAFSFGMSLYHSVRSISDETDQSRSHLVLSLSLFIVPIPVIIALSSVTFTNRLFFIFLYSVCALNFLLPGIHLSQRKNTHYRKGLYFTLLIMIVPLVVLAHLYFNIKLDESLFVRHIKNFESVYRAGSHADYYDFEEDIYFNDHRVMTISDMFMRNLRRCVFTLSFFVGGRGDNVLFIDGVKKFVENRSYELFPDAICLDYVPEHRVDFNNPPVSGAKSVITFHDEMLDFFRKRSQRYRVIVDIPNIYDQNVNSFKFSDGYYSLVKDHLSDDGGGIFMQMIQPGHAQSVFVQNAKSALPAIFKYVIMLDYGDTIAFLGTDNSSYFQLNESRISRLRSLFTMNAANRLLFVDEAHCLSYIMPLEKDSSAVYSRVNSLSLMLSEQTASGITRQNMDKWIHTNDTVFHDPFLPDNSLQVSELKEKFALQNETIATIKRAEYADSKNDYISESFYLSQLQQKAENDYALRHYLEGIIEVKEKTYLSLAEQYESDRQWTKAREVYLSILNLQKDNFEANYRLGMIYVTLQDFQEANRFLLSAMELQKDNPRVIYQMGVLLYARGDMQGAVNYLERAISLKTDDAQIYFFLGLAYESLGRLNDAKRSLQTADLKDPANQDIQSALSRINKSIEDTQYQYEPVLKRNDRESEQGESVPLPVNRNARESRITDEELSRYSVAQKGEGSEYAEKFAKDPRLKNKQPEQNGEEGFFDLFRGGQ